MLFYLSVCTIVVLKMADITVPYLSLIMLSITAGAMIFALIKYFLLFLDLLKNSDANQNKEGE